MAKVKNISVFGDVDVPALRLTVLAGQTIEVSDEVAESLLAQVGNWAQGESTSTSSADSSAAPANKE